MPFILANGVNFHYEVLGTETDKNPIILIAGYACDINFWRPVAEKFAKRTQVLIFDNQGIGRTQDHGGHLTIEEMVRNTKALIDQLQQNRQFKANPYDIAGFAMGGLIAQQFAATYKDNTNRLMLLNSVLKFNDEAKAGCEALCKAREEGNLIKYGHLIYDIFVGQDFRNRTPDKDAFARGFADAVKDTQTPEGQRRQIELLKVCDTSVVAPSIEAPTLLIQAEPKDIFALPEEVEALRKAIETGGTEVEICKVTSGHATILENFDVFMEVITPFFIETLIA